MKRIALIIIAFGLMFNAGAQTFKFYPSRSCVDSIGLSGLLIRDVKVVNTSNAVVNLKWKVLLNTMPNVWEYSLCDNGNCYISVPDSGASDPLKGFDTASLKMNVGADGNPGMGVIKIIWYDKNSMFTDTLSYLFATKTASGINENSVNQFSFLLYPNPGQDQINIRNNDGLIKRVGIYNIDGKLLLQENLSSPEFILNTITLKNGLYILKCTNEKGFTGVKSLIINR